MAMKKCYFQQDRALSHYHRRVSDFLNAHLYATWLEGRRNAEIYTNGILYEEHCVSHKVITSERLRLEILITCLHMLQSIVNCKQRNNKLLFFNVKEVSE
jgi:hypothetical protein